MGERDSTTTFPSFSKLVTELITGGVWIRGWIWNSACVSVVFMGKIIDKGLFKRRN